MTSFTLYVGDCHAEVTSLAEMEKLIDLIQKSADEHEVDQIVFLGDQYHNHSLVHLQVMEFWERAFKRLAGDRYNGTSRQITALVGNHDRAGYANSKAHSLMLHKNVNIVDTSRAMYDEFTSDIIYVSYQHKPEDFIKICKENKSHTVVCHQTFFGSKYENGFYAPAKDSINPDDIPQKLIISGHIHTAQQFGKVWYTGSPRWRIATDANVEKYIYLVQHESDGSIVSKHPISTKSACKPIYELSDSKEEPVYLTPTHLEGSVIINVTGTIDYVKDRKEAFERLGARVRGFPTKNYTTDIRESDGIQNSFIKFVNKFESKNGTSPERLLELSKRIVWT